MKTWIHELQQSLQHTLPGAQAHQKMMNYKRASVEEARAMVPPPRQSSVMMLLFPHLGALHTLFILRASYDGVHSGQVAFPGGKREPADESLLHTALRETEEEIGISKECITLVGNLSDIFIPPSHMLVTPYIGFVESLPELKPDSREVHRILLEPVQAFLPETSLRTKNIFIKHINERIQVPCFEVQGETVWGATAMILMEFREAIAPLHLKSNFIA